MRREAGAIATVLAEESRARRTAGRRYGIVHVSVNPPEALWDLPDSRDGFRRLRSLAYRIAKRAGLEGGAWVFHRERCADKDDPITTDGPHFHCLGFGWIDAGQFARTGWVVRNHGLRRTRRSVVGTAQYVLSHSHRAEGILPEGKSAGLTLTVTWTGRLLGTDEIPENGPYCPLCELSFPKSEWWDAEWIGQGPPPRVPVTFDTDSWRAYKLDRTCRWSVSVVQEGRSP